MLLQYVCKYIFVLIETAMKRPHLKQVDYATLSSRYPQYDPITLSSTPVDKLADKFSFRFLKTINSCKSSFDIEVKKTVQKNGSSHNLQRIPRSSVICYYPYFLI
jgi:hypothetical protein